MLVSAVIVIKSIKKPQSSVDIFKKFMQADSFSSASTLTPSFGMWQYFMKSEPHRNMTFILKNVRTTMRGRKAYSRFCERFAVTLLTMWSILSRGNWSRTNTSSIWAINACLASNKYWFARVWKLLGIIKMFCLLSLISTDMSGKVPNCCNDFLLKVLSAFNPLFRIAGEIISSSPRACIAWATFRSEYVFSWVASGSLTFFVGKIVIYIWNYFVCMGPLIYLLEPALTGKMTMCPQPWTRVLVSGGFGFVVSDGQRGSVEKFYLICW